MSDDVNPEVEVEQVEAPVVIDDVSNEDDAVLDRLIGDEDDSVSDDTIEAEQQPEVVAHGDDWDDITQVLRRDNVPDSVIESADEDTLREWANKARKRQGDVDEYGSKLKDLQSKLEHSDDNAAEDGEDTDSESTDPLENVNVPEVLADIVGDEAATAIVEMIENGKQQAAVTAQQAAAQSHMVAKIMAADSVVRPVYGSKAPATDALLAEMSRLGTENPNTFESVDAMLQAAYINLSGNPPEKKRKTSQPTPTRAQPRRVAKSPPDVDEVALDMLMSGKSKADVSQALK